MTRNTPDIRGRLGLRPVINVSGTMTALGGSICVPEAVEAAGAKVTAWELADRLLRGEPPVVVRDHEIEHGFFELDPCNLHPGEAERVAQRLCAELDAAIADPSHQPQSLSDFRKTAAHAPAWANLPVD